MGSKYAREVFDEHAQLLPAGGHPGGGPPWTLSFNNAVRCAGACYYNRRTIVISRRYLAAVDKAAIRNAVLHEISHGIAGHGAGHGAAWRDVFISLGGDGERTCPAFAEHRYTYECPRGCVFKRHVARLAGRLCKRHILPLTLL